nr:hypothetical protein [Frankia sp. ArI3]
MRIVWPFSPVRRVWPSGENVSQLPEDGSVWLTGVGLAGSVTFQDWMVSPRVNRVWPSREKTNVWTASVLPGWPT